jgi:hypothetical protein
MVDMCPLFINAHEILTFLSPNANNVQFELHFLLNCQAFLNFHTSQSSIFLFLKADSNFILELSSFCNSILLWCEFIYCNNFNKTCHLCYSIDQQKTLFTYSLVTSLSVFKRNYVAQKMTTHPHGLSPYHVIMCTRSTHLNEYRRWIIMRDLTLL